MLNQVMSATRGATDAFSGVSRHVNASVRQHSSFSYLHKCCYNLLPSLTFFLYL